MKAFTKFLALVFAVGLVTYGCKPESTVNPKKDGSPELGLTGEDPHDRPNPQCMASVFANLQDQQGSLIGGDDWDWGRGNYGSVEVVNDPDRVSVLLSMGEFWLCAEGSLWIGQCGNVPIANDGSVNWESFGWGSAVPIVQYYQWDIPNTSLNLDASGCACVVVVCEGVQADFYGNATNNTLLWAKNSTSPAVGTDGWAITACPVECPFLTGDECNDIDRSVGRNCEDINLVASTAGQPGAGPFVFNLYNSTGAVVGTVSNTTGTATFNVCPTAASGAETYTATVTDNRSVYTDSLTVSVSVTPSCAPPCVTPVVGPGADLSAYGCGNTAQGEQKVNVCHLPPGNPANRQMICIAVSALPAHIIDFKPADNRCLGHSSGCHIGPCDPCGPGTSDDAIARAAAYRQQYGCGNN